MKPDEFEQKLERQTLRPVPAEWRDEILAAAGANRRKTPEADRAFTSAATGRSWRSTLNHQLSALLWPHPKAWAGLAAVWVLILAANFSIRDPAPVVAEKSAPPSPDVLVELKQQRRLLAELIGPRDTPEADRSKSLAPRPRTERVEFMGA
jgi:hypothetical protein